MLGQLGELDVLTFLLPILVKVSVEARSVLFPPSALAAPVFISTPLVSVS